jgi:hypothetical protein
LRYKENEILAVSFFLGHPLERVQKSAIKVFLQGNYNGYQIGLAQLGLEDPETRREQLCLDFAPKNALNIEN